MEFSNSLIHWYLQNKRDLPWRNTTNPYPIWLSEIMLQQTRVAQGLPYFLSFTDAFPTIFDLANADAVTWSLGQVRGPRKLPVRIVQRS